MNSGTTTITEIPSGLLMARLCHEEHAGCFACRRREEGGLGLDFRVDGQEVSALWTCPDDKESYKGIVHGGILATILDSSMVHALFAYGIIARTGQLNIRYRGSVVSKSEIIIKAVLKEHRHPLYILNASIEQGGRICVEASAKFMATDRIGPTDSCE